MADRSDVQKSLNHEARMMYPPRPGQRVWQYVDERLKEGEKPRAIARLFSMKPHITTNYMAGLCDGNWSGTEITRFHMNGHRFDNDAHVFPEA